MPTRLEQMQKKRDQLNARIQAERAKHDKKKRKEDTRRKVLIGAAILKALEAGDLQQHHIDAILKKHLSRENDRKFMGLNDGA